MQSKKETWYTNVYLTADDIYEKLSEDDKKRFNKAFIVGVESDWQSNGVDIACVLVNDCPIEIDKNEKHEEAYRYKALDDGEITPFKR